MKRATIKDVARTAGVDISTVSRVLNDKPRVAPATRARIERAIVELGYRRDAAARTMVTRRTRTFALLVPDLADPTVAEIAKGAERRARDEGYTMLLAGHHLHPARTDAHDVLGEHRVDGVLLMSPRQLPTDDPGVPFATLEEAPVDDAGGGRAVAILLAGLGHDRVGFVGGPAESGHARDRLEGFRAVFGHDVAVRFGSWSSDDGRRCALELLDAAPDVTAVFAASDTVALGVLHALSERGLRVPSDVSVVGFDDLAFARHLAPPLTTVAQPLSAVGARAFEVLLARIDGDPVPTPGALPVHLVERGSTGPAKAGGR